MLNKKIVKLWFLLASLCLAKVSLSNMNVYAREENIETRLFKKLEVAVAQGRLKECKADIKRVLKLNPRHPGATFYAGLYAYENNDFTNAEKFLHRIENHYRYGTDARKILAEIHMKRLQAQYLETLNIALTGEVFTQALKLCDEILAEIPDNQDVLFLGAYAATMNGDKDLAESYSHRYQKTNATEESKAELKAFTEAIFAAAYSPETSVEKLINITDPRLLTPAVRRKLKKLIVSLNKLDLFEKFIIQEKSRPGSDIDNLERELIEFLIEQKQYQKAMDLINRRPITQIEDNILLLKLLILTAQEIKSMLMARYLLSAHPTDLRVYDSWIEAWLSYVDRTSEIPKGYDEAGKSFEEMAEEVLDRLKLDILVKVHPTLLLKLLRLAVLSQNEPKVKEITNYATRISFNKKNVDLLLETVEKLILVNRSSIAANLLESARNQLPDDYRLSIKLGEIYLYNNNPEVAAQIFEDVLREKPEQIRTFLLWTDCMTLMNQAYKAEKAILTRLENHDLNEIVRRQLTNKLEVIRMQNSIGTEKLDFQSQISKVFSKQPENPHKDHVENNTDKDSLQYIEGKTINEEIKKEIGANKSK